MPPISPPMITSKPALSRQPGLRLNTRMRTYTPCLSVGTHEQPPSVRRGCVASPAGAFSRSAMRLALARRLFLALALIAGTATTPAVGQSDPASQGLEESVGRPVDQPACTQDDFNRVVDAAGEKLRAFNERAMPELERRFDQLKTRKGWGSATSNERVADYLADARTAALDAKAGRLLAKLDRLGQLEAEGAPDCSKLAELEATGLELLAVMKAKRAHMEGKLATELSGAPANPDQTAALRTDPGRGDPAADPILGRKPSNAKTPGLPDEPAPAATDEPALPNTTATATADQDNQWRNTDNKTDTRQPVEKDETDPSHQSAGTPTAKPSTSAKKPSTDASGEPLVAATSPTTSPATSPWQTETKAATPGPRDDFIAAQRRAIENTPDPDTSRTAILDRPSGDAERRATLPNGGDGEPLTPTQGYTMAEIRQATRGFFGTISTNLGSVIEYAFQNWGRPTGYILGKEGGGAFLAGLRYGKGTLYPRYGQPETVYWHGPSLGYDFGAAGSRTLILVYQMSRTTDLHRMFTGVDGSAYLVGGVGLTVLKGGPMIMTPIRSGLGLRLGANVGYLRFTNRPTWNPF